MTAPNNQRHQQHQSGLVRRFYFDRPTFIDGTTLFHEVVRRTARTALSIVEIGPGPANPSTQFLATLGPVIGIDIDDAITDNPFLSEHHVYDGITLPLDDRSIDLCVSNYVLEHIASPRHHFAEIARVLRAGGAYIFRTPNLFHYVSATSRLLPHSAHLRLVPRLHGRAASEHPPYPTFYRANTRRALRQLSASAGLRVQDLLFIEKEPAYAAASPLLFYPMMLYERLVNSSALLSHFRSNIIGIVTR